MKHYKKMIAPVIITILLVVYYVGIAYFMSTIHELPWIMRILYIGVPFILAIVMIGVLISRIKEIRSGEEDDLSQY